MMLIENLNKTTLFSFIIGFRPIESFPEAIQYLTFQEKLYDLFILEVDDNMINNFTVEEKLKYLYFTRERSFDFFDNGNPFDKSAVFNNCETLKKHNEKYSSKDENSITKIALKYFEEYANENGINELKNEIKAFETHNFSFPRVSFPFLDDAKNKLIELLEEIKKLDLIQKTFEMILSGTPLSTIPEPEVRYYCRLILLYVLKIRSSEILWEIMGYCTINIKLLSKDNGIEKHFINQTDLPRLIDLLIKNDIIDIKQNWKGLLIVDRRHTARNILYALIESLNSNGIIKQDDDVNIRKDFCTHFNIPIGSGIKRIQDKNVKHDDYVKRFNRIIAQMK